MITGSNNITLRKVIVNLHGYCKTYTDKHLIEDKLYELIHRFNDIKISHKKVYFTLLDSIHFLNYGNGRTCQILFHWRSLGQKIVEEKSPYFKNFFQSFDNFPLVKLFRYPLTNIFQFFLWAMYIYLYLSIYLHIYRYIYITSVLWHGNVSMFYRLRL